MIVRSPLTVFTARRLRPSPMTTVRSFRPSRTIRAGTSHSRSPLAVWKSQTQDEVIRPTSTSPLIVLSRLSRPPISGSRSIEMSPLTVCSSQE